MRLAKKRKTMKCYLPTSASRVSCNPFSEAEEKGHGELPVKKMKWKSLKKLMIMKRNGKRSEIKGEKKTQNLRQINLKISKKAISSAESSVSSMKRPIRKRKTIERYSSLQNSASRASRKPFQIVKGKGTRLKDIPKVACKLSQSKYDDNLQILHTILFGRRTKVHASRNIRLFSGFVWVENEEKQKSQVMQRINKCVKEKLLDLCDILDIPISNKSYTKKGIAAKILEFLENPRLTVHSLIADKASKQKVPRRTQTKSRKKHKLYKSIQHGQEPSACNKTYSEDDENDRMSAESDPNAWYNYKYGRHEDVEVDDDLWDTDWSTAYHLYKYGRRVYTPWC